LIYRGVDAVKLAEYASVEDIAAHLWQCDALRPVKSAISTFPESSSKARAFSYLAKLAVTGPQTLEADRSTLSDHGTEILCGFADAISGAQGRGLFHQKLARFWRLDPNGADLLRRTLVLVADHELNPSSFAARVTASTGASLAACALSGFATLSGPRHGNASAQALKFLQLALRTGTEAAPSKIDIRPGDIPAVGHALYPNGDPRAKALLKWMRLSPTLKQTIRAAEKETGQAANIDMALAALCLHLDIPKDAPLIIFAAGRIVGWIAHAMEQSLSEKMIRPRAKYLGT
jgi:citrate synthase